MLGASSTLATCKKGLVFGGATPAVKLYHNSAEQGNAIAQTTWYWKMVWC